MPTELRLFGTAVFTGGCYLSPEAAGSELEGAGSLLCAVSSDRAAGIFIHAAYSAGKARNRDTLFTIPSFLSSNRGNDILFANFSWKQRGRISSGPLPPPGAPGTRADQHHGEIRPGVLYHGSVLCHRTGQHPPQTPGNGKRGT